MRVLVLGANGMLGHVLVHTLAKESSLEVHGTVNENVHNFYYSNNNVNLIKNLSAYKISEINLLISKIKPDTVINCIADTRIQPDTNALKSYIYINSIFPRLLSFVCKENTTNFIHISTDAVHSGEKKSYTEGDIPDPICIYGLSKLASEVVSLNAIVIRTSFIGFDNRGKGFLCWALRQVGEIDGYKNDLFSGLSNIELSRAIFKCFIDRQTSSYGIYNICGQPISKFDLLNLIKEKFNLKFSLKECYKISRTRVLDPEKIHSLTDYKAPDWSQMLDELKKNQHFYSGFQQSKT